MKHLLILLTLLAFGSGSVHAADAKKTEGKKKVQYRKTQSVDFDETDIDGQVRSPDGAYLLQKRGVKFLPLYKVNNQFEKNILESVEYLN
ncbi:MAG TPA: hypothetical protein PKC28_07165 [Bdellovibrionales bacterium]|nr:hypothetical protein [Bdellovibrionales bacterium]